MSDIATLLDSIPIGDIAKQVGVDDDTAEDAIRQILPGLVGGMKANADDAGGAASLTKALSNHQGKPLSAKGVDTADGQKIVKNVFGENTDAVASKLAESSPKSAVTSDLIQKILPIVAPIVLAWLANQFFGKKEQPAASAPSTSGSSGGGIGDILGELLGGGSGGSSSSGGGDILGGLLGGLLGGGKK